MIELDCNSLCRGVIDGACKFQVLAITKDEMRALLEAHLKQEHREELSKLGEEEFKIIYQRIDEKFR